MVCGDFNDILYSFENKRGDLREETQMKAFRETLSDYQLVDVGYVGSWFTWELGNLSGNNIKERLDKGVTNKKLRDLFPLVTIQHILYSTFDHMMSYTLLDRNNWGRKVTWH